MAASLLSLALILAAQDSVSGTVPDTLQAPRLVRTLEAVVVRATPLHDPLSSQSVQLIPTRRLRELPIDHLADAIALKAGIVAQGGALHVRGGRAGDTRLLLRGIPLQDDGMAHRIRATLG